MTTEWMTQLEYPFLLWLLLPWIGIWVYSYFRQTKQTTHTAISSIPVMEQPYSWRTHLDRWKGILLCLSGCFLLIGMSGPFGQEVEKKISGEGIDIFLALDLSASMLAKDFTPNRLEVAKEVATAFALQRPYDRIGITAFAGESYTVSPLTLDKSVLQQFIRLLEIGQLKDGTAIGMGLATAINRLNSSKATSKVVILLTDGMNNSGYIAPHTAKKIAIEKGIKVYTIGIGTKGRALVPAGIRNGEFFYQMAKVAIDEQLLTDIAEATGGTYFRAQNKTELEQIYNMIDRLEKSEVQVEIIEHNIPNLWPWMLAAGLMILLYGIITNFILKLWP